MTLARCAVLTPMVGGAHDVETNTREPVCDCWRELGSRGFGGMQKVGLGGEEASVKS